MDASGWMGGWMDGCVHACMHVCMVPCPVFPRGGGARDPESGLIYIPRRNPGKKYQNVSEISSLWRNLRPAATGLDLAAIWWSRAKITISVVNAIRIQEKLPISWWFMMIDDLWWFMMIYDDLWWFTIRSDIYDDLWWLMIYALRIQLRINPVRTSRVFDLITPKLPLAMVKTHRSGPLG